MWRIRARRAAALLVTFDASLKTGPAMNMARYAADVVKNHAVFELESIDRMYLNLSTPGLQRGQAAAPFFRFPMILEPSSSRLDSSCLKIPATGSSMK